MQKKPNPIDAHVGERVRMRRRELGLTQSCLGEALGLKCQQIHKYERGANRISASRLFQIARALDVPVQYFYDGLYPIESPSADVMLSSEMKQLIFSKSGKELLKAIEDIPTQDVRQNLIHLTTAVARECAESISPKSEKKKRGRSL